ncbi:MAG: GNAT family N-acetyltransferase [Micropruina sp.]|uniref:GNAT family N-acetyltransferase n=1 Tax=Micropruina sp. TaxID=2737536 RepID=UPI0039E5A779
MAAQELPVSAPTSAARPAGARPSGTGQAVTDELRPARFEDAAELLVLQRACWTSDAILNDTFEIPALYEGLDVVRASLDRWETWVLRRGSRLIGAVRGHLHGTDWEIGRLMVAPDLQGHGLGRMLLLHIERQAPASARRLWLITGKRSESNLRFYARAGYRVLPDEDDSLPHVPHTVRLVKTPD